MRFLGRGYTKANNNVRARNRYYSNGGTTCLAPVRPYVQFFAPSGEKKDKVGREWNPLEKVHNMSITRCSSIFLGVPSPGRALTASAKQQAAELGRRKPTAAGCRAGESLAIPIATRLASVLPASRLRGAQTPKRPLPAVTSWRRALLRCNTFLIGLSRGRGGLTTSQNSIMLHRAEVDLSRPGSETVVCS